MKKPSAPLAETDSSNRLDHAGTSCASVAERETSEGVNEVSLGGIHFQPLSAQEKTAVRYDAVAWI
jgi:hypothetical protein